MSLSHHIPPIYPDKVNGAHERNPDGWNRVGSFVSKADFQTINAAAGQSGTISFIIDQAIHLTAEHIRQHGYQPVLDTHRFLQYLRERSFGEPTSPTQGTAGDDTGRIESARESVANPTDVPTSSGPAVAGGLGGKSKVRKRPVLGES